MTLAPFCNAQDISDRLGRTFSTAEVTQASAFCDDASQLIRDYLRQDVNAVSGRTMDIEAPDGPWLILPQLPVTAVTSVAVNGNTVTDFSKIGDRLYRVYGWRWPSVDTVPPLAIYGLKSTVHVVYDSGYATVPSVIVAVCRRVAMRAVDNPTGLQSVTIDDYTPRYAVAGTGVFLTTDDEKALRRYRRGAFSVSIGSGDPPW